MTSELVEVKVPDIGDTADAEVVEILVATGQTIDVEDSVVTLESDKASMEVPSSSAGVVETVHVAVGDKVGEGKLLLTLKASTKPTTVASNESAVPAPAPETIPSSPIESTASQTDYQALVAVKSENASGTEVTIEVPDIGDVPAVEVIDVMVSVGDTIEVDQALVTVEGDKATMDIPATHAGQVSELLVKIGDKVAQGTPLMLLATNSPAVQQSVVVEQPAKQVAVQQAASAVRPLLSSGLPAEVPAKPVLVAGNEANVYASPSVRRLAREFGVDLSQVTATGRKGRVLSSDVQAFVKSKLAQGNNTAGGELPIIPVVDFAKYGPIETVALNKIKRLTAQHMQRAWLNVPHVTQFDEADITDTEAFRQANKLTADGVKMTLLAFVVVSTVKALQRFPHFNASLGPNDETLVLKHHYHIGIAVDTPNGLVVPVIRDADRLQLGEIATAMVTLSQKARDGKLLPGEMAGGTFSISSLGGIGGTAFTPIVNAPEVAILGLSRSYQKPVYVDGSFQPRLTLPLSLSYDHRVIDGAEAARFTAYLSELLSDTRKILL